MAATKLDAAMPQRYALAPRPIKRARRWTGRSELPTGSVLRPD